MLQNSKERETILLSVIMLLSTVMLKVVTAFERLHFEDRLLTLHANVRLECNRQTHQLTEGTLTKREG